MHARLHVLAGWTFLMGPLLAALVATQAPAQSSSSFTYQGELTQSGTLVNDVCDFTFEVCTVPVGDDCYPTVVTMTGVSVVDGRFTVELDFPVTYFESAGRWLRIGVRCPAGSGAYTTLSPNQPITHAPFAIRTRGIAVDPEGNVGIGTESPEARLHVEGDDASLRLENSASAGSSVIEDRESIQLTVTKNASPGEEAIVDVSPHPLDGASRAGVRFFRYTNTSGQKYVHFLRGNHTSSPSAAIGVDGDASWFQAHGGNLGVGVTDPAAGKLEVYSGAGGAPNAVNATSENEVFPTAYLHNSVGGPSLWADGTSDVTVTGGGVAMFGKLGQQNIAIDGNEIMARNGQSTAPLYLNAEGGDINMGPHQIHPALAYGWIDNNTGSWEIRSGSSNVTAVIWASGFVVEIDVDLDGTEIVCASGQGAQTGVSHFVYPSSDTIEFNTLHLPSGTWGPYSFHFVVYRP